LKKRGDTGQGGTSFGSHQGTSRGLIEGKTCTGASSTRGPPIRRPLPILFVYGVNRCIRGIVWFH